MNPSASQIRAARALLGWSADRLAEEAEVSLSTVRRIENDDPKPISPDNWKKINACFAAQDIVFLEDELGFTSGVATVDKIYRQPIPTKTFRRFVRLYLSKSDSIKKSDISQLIDEFFDVVDLSYREKNIHRSNTPFNIILRENVDLYIEGLGIDPYMDS